MKENVNKDLLKTCDLRASLNTTGAGQLCQNAKPKKTENVLRFRKEWQTVQIKLSIGNVV